MKPRHSIYKRLADELSRKQDKQYSLVMGWIRCRLSFAILRSAILCIRGSRSSRHRPVRELNIELAAAEGHVPSDMCLVCLLLFFFVFFLFLFFLSLYIHVSISSVANT